MTESRGVVVQLTLRNGLRLGFGNVPVHIESGRAKLRPGLRELSFCLIQCRLKWARVNLKQHLMCILSNCFAVAMVVFSALDAARATSVRCGALGPEAAATALKFFLIITLKLLNHVAAPSHRQTSSEGILGGLPMAGQDVVLYQEEAGIALLTLHRPEVLNALNMATLERLLALLDGVRTTASVRAAIITGSGTAAFSAGADIPRHS